MALRTGPSAAQEMNKRIAAKIKKRTDELSMPRPKGIPKTGGRKKGTRNKCRKDLVAFAQEMFKQVDMIAKGKELLDHKDARVQAMVWNTIMAYNFGRPREQLVVSGSVDMRSIVAQARERVLGITQPSKSLPVLNMPASDTLETPRNLDDGQVVDSIQQ